MIIDPSIIRGLHSLDSAEYLLGRVVTNALSGGVGMPSTRYANGAIAALDRALERFGSKVPQSTIDTITGVRTQLTTVLESSEPSTARYLTTGRVFESMRQDIDRSIRIIKKQQPEVLVFDQAAAAGSDAVASVVPTRRDIRRLDNAAWLTDRLGVMRRPAKIERMIEQVERTPARAIDALPTDIRVDLERSYDALLSTRGRLSSYEGNSVTARTTELLTGFRKAHTWLDENIGQLDAAMVDANRAATIAREQGTLLTPMASTLSTQLRTLSALVPDVFSYNGYADSGKVREVRTLVDEFNAVARPVLPRRFADAVDRVSIDLAAGTFRRESAQDVSDQLRALAGAIDVIEVAAREGTTIEAAARTRATELRTLIDGGGRAAMSTGEARVRIDAMLDADSLRGSFEMLSDVAGADGAVLSAIADDAVRWTAADVEAATPLWISGINEGERTGTMEAMHRARQAARVAAGGDAMSSATTSALREVRLNLADSIDVSSTIAADDSLGRLARADELATTARRMLGNIAKASYPSNEGQNMRLVRVSLDAAIEAARPELPRPFLEAQLASIADYPTSVRDMKSLGAYVGQAEGDLDALSSMIRARTARRTGTGMVPVPGVTDAPATVTATRAAEVPAMESTAAAASAPRRTSISSLWDEVQ